MKSIAILLATLIIASVQLLAKDQPFLHFDWHGGLSQYSEIVVSIAQDGSTDVTADKRDKRLEHHTTLTPEELEALRTLVRSTGFFSEPEKDSAFATDVGSSCLTIALDGRERTLEFGYRPPLQPLEQFLYRLLAQAEAFDSLGAGKTYDVYTAVSPLTASAKALQPYRLQQPLMDYIRRETDQGKRVRSLGALAYVTTPEQFAGFVASFGFPGSPGALPLMGDLPMSHRQALCPFYLAYLKANYARLADFRKESSGPAHTAVDLLGELRYEPAIPFFLDWFEQNNVTDLHGLYSIARLRAAGVRELAAKLDHPDGAHRDVAMDLLALAARHNPHNPIPDPMSDWEYDQMKDLFSRTVLPKLAQLAATAPVDAKSSKATKTAELIKAEMAK